MLGGELPFFSCKKVITQSEMPALLLTPNRHDTSTAFLTFLWLVKLQTCHDSHLPRLISCSAGVKKKDFPPPPDSVPPYPITHRASPSQPQQCAHLFTKISVSLSASHPGSYHPAIGTMLDTCPRSLFQWTEIGNAKQTSSERTCGSISFHINNGESPSV